jgi:shikimate dehydrogenase
MEIKKKYGLIGKSLGHSFSRTYFTHKFKILEIDSVYENFEFETIEDLSKFLETTDCKGFNVTIPYKETILSLVNRLEEVAQEVGAVNTLKKVDGVWFGYNTDVFGFKQMIKPFFKSHHERAIILGTGGASKAVAYVLENLGCEVIFISRNPKKENEFSYEDINKQMLSSCKIVVNTTPVGTFPNSEEKPQIPYEFITEMHLCIDLTYNPSKTAFLDSCEKKRAWILNGKTMLEQQAEKSWQIWNE